MSEKKPTPIFPAPTPGRVCPVCHKRAYSAGGIHPQCAVRQADAPREAALAVAKRKARLLAVPK